MASPKILVLDIETAPITALVWGRWDQNISMDQVLRESYIICWAAKWLNEKKVYTGTTLKPIRKLMDEADYVIAHNGARFDIPILNSSFIRSGLNPPSNYRVLDTLRIAKRLFKFTSNKLDDLGKMFKVGEKLDTGGFKLWKSVVIDMDPKALKKMMKYNIQDVLLLEKVYHKLKAWDKSGPNVAIEHKNCSSCGSGNVRKNGRHYTASGHKQKYICGECGFSMIETKKGYKGV